MRLRLLALLTIALLMLGAVPSYAGSSPALTVTVTDTDGRPILGARVELIAPGEGSVASVVTNSSGRAALPGTRSTPAIFWVRTWGAGRVTLDRPWVPAADGQSLTIQLPDLAGSMAGLVLDHLGRPVAGAKVSAWRKDAGLAAEAQSGDGGQFVLRGLPVPGPYQIQVAAAGFRPFASQPTQAASGEEKRLDITLAPATGTITGEAVDARTGAPLGSARVELLRKGWSILSNTLTGPDGTFRLTAPPSDTPDYTVRVWAAGHGLGASQPFALAPGGHKGFTGADRLVAQGFGASVWGVVTDDLGNPVLGAPVELQLQGVGTAATAVTDASGFYTFDGAEAGIYRVRAFPQNTSSGLTITESAWVQVAGGASRYIEVAMPRYTRRTYGLGILAGQVQDLSNAPVAGATVSLLRLDEGVAFTATTDSQGRYRITSVDANRTTDTRPAGPGYVVRVEKDGFVASDQPVQAVTPAAAPGTAGTGTPAALVDVTTGRVTQADFLLRPDGGTLTVAVEDDQGTPLPGAQISLYRDGAGSIATARANAGGSYKFTGLTAPLLAGFVAEAQAPGYFTAAAESPADVAAAPGAAARVTLRLRPAAARLQGRVTGSEGEPVGGAAVTAINPADGSTYNATADDNGWYGLDGLPAGPGDALLVRATAQGAAAATAPDGAILLSGLRARTANLTLAPAGSVAGTVYGTDGAPLSGGTAELWREGQAAPVSAMNVGPDGTYRFDGLSPGDRYTVLARADGALPSAIAPGEASVTPLFGALAGETVPFDIALSAQ